MIDKSSNETSWASLDDIGEDLFFLCQQL